MQSSTLRLSLPPESTHTYTHTHTYIYIYTYTLPIPIPIPIPISIFIHISTYPTISIEPIKRHRIIILKRNYY